MIPLQTKADDSWQQQLRDAIRSPAELAAALGLEPSRLGFSAQADDDFAMKVPRAFVGRMQPGDADDPLLRQVLAGSAENAPHPGYSDDPVGETGAANPVPGIIHKYHGRLLMTVASGCAVNCRYCFRRHFPYGENQLSRREWQDAIAYIRADTSITEVILSGGDPLVARDDTLSALMDALAAVPHVTTLRIHTRLPVVIPDRVTPGLLRAICRPGIATVMVLHSNHPNEVDTTVAAAAGRLREAGVTLLNQSVLLTGVNDSADTLSRLSSALFGAGVLPYYVHLLDRVRGAAHFAVDETRARELVGELAVRCPGYFVPRLVRESSGEGSKRELTPRYPY
ncbi:EF-P beta-lysylation protein EpmB [Chromatocurvus halotolerans]|uniref:EF-P beta-lysylation protein EpmB n=1 Tax=Chromatocurvus halotolerans TaxID=1132028 RepID=UPI003B8A8A81